MNCANHPETAAVAYCQQCGKPMCAGCAHSVGNLVNCEPCLAARLGVNGRGQVPPIFPPEHPNPVLAGLLGLIPGVGAMYNGQFVKALAHVLIFAVFVSLSHASGLFALFVMAWVFYQVFDAYQTARARRDGLPLPNPFGLNDLGVHLGIAAPGITAPAPPPAGAAGAEEATAAQPGSPYPGSVPAPPPLAGAPPDVPPVSPPYAPGESQAPAGAIVLIVVGLLLLLDTLGIVRMYWIGRSWPLLLIGLGVWLAIRGRRSSGGGDLR